MANHRGFRQFCGRFAAALVACCLLAAFAQPFSHPALAAAAPPPRFIAIAYDDSGSMRLNAAGKTINHYIYANYSLQNLVALMEQRDSAKVYLISKKGREPITVNRQKDLHRAMKGIGAYPKGDTYAETVGMAMKDGAAFLKAEPQGEFLFVLVTDGESMYDERGKEIKGTLRGVFEKSLKDVELDGYKGRSKALLLSIGSAKPLAPVSDLQSVLKQSGIPAEVFTADVTRESAAGANIMAAMTDLAEAVASTNMMAIEPGQPFTIRYPLESLVIMEQFRQSSESTVTGIAGQAGGLVRSTLYTTKAIGGVKLASTFSSIRAKEGSIKPGTYTIKTSGPAKLMAFSKVGFTAVVEIADSGGNQVAAYRGGKWSVDGIVLDAGDELTAVVSFLALDGTAVEMDPHVRMELGTPERFRCEPAGKGSFLLKAASPGRDYLAVTLDDPKFFQLSIPPLPVTVSVAATEAPSSPVETALPSGNPASPAPTASGEEDAEAIEPLPRQVKVELSPARLEFSVMDSAEEIPTCAFRVMVLDHGAWAEIKAEELSNLQLIGPGGLDVRLDPAGQAVVVHPAWLPALTPVGQSAVVIRAGTGKPGETAEAVIEVIVRDDWRKWLQPGVGLLVLCLLAAYALAIALKKRIPLKLEVNVSPNADMTGFSQVELRRRKIKRALWPFGREVCTVGLLELYPHPKSREKVVLSSVAVQYGLQLDGKPPQFHKDRDSDGDFVLSGDTVASVRENGAYRYYRFTYHDPKPLKAKKPAQRPTLRR